MTTDIDELIGRVPKPKKGQHIFTGADDWWHDACLDWCSGSWEMYIAGYKEAADLLVMAVVERKGTPDSLIYPIMYLYRQYLELRLKDVLREGSRLLDKEYDFRPDHNLERLWKPVRNIIETVWPNGDKEQLDAMDDLIAQFSSKDPVSTAFRYPVNNDKTVMLKGVPRINVRHVSEIVESMATVLEGSAAGISEYSQIKQDMRIDAY